VDEWEHLLIGQCHRCEWRTRAVDKEDEMASTAWTVACICAW